MHALTIIGRVAAFAVGCIAFYLAFFLYESEDGIWQNRIDTLWKAVYKRALKTDTVWTALINKSVQVLLSLTDRMFGEPLFSAQMVAVSVNLSFFTTILTLVVGEALEGDFDHSNYMPWLITAAACILPAGLIVLTLRFRRRSVALLASVPWIIFLSGNILVTLFWIKDMNVALSSAASAVIALVSLFVDVIAIAYLRHIFKSLAVRPSIVPVLKAVAVLTMICTILSLPLIYYIRVRSTVPEGVLLNPLVVGGTTSFTIMNLDSIVFCFIPAVIFVALLVHKAIWPTLSRALSPFHRYKILVNQKGMAAVGCLAWTFAFNLEKVGAKELLKLLS